MKISIAKKGNMKVCVPTWNKACHRWSEGTTCPGCYALKAYKQYPSVREAWGKNATAHKGDIIQEITDFLLSNPKIKYFRVHSSGEFTDLADLGMWMMIANLNPGVVFYGYSKEQTLFRGIELPDNLRIRVNPDVNYGTQEFIDETMAKNPGKFWQCPCGMPGVNNKGICGKRCKACMLAPKDKLPLFLQH